MHHVWTPLAIGIPGKVEEKPAATPGSLLNLYMLSVGLHDLGGNGETESRPADMAVPPPA